MEMNIRNIKSEKIARVYSGKSGCMCGCRGKYWSATWADDKNYQEKSDRQIKRVVRVLNDAIKAGSKIEYDRWSNCFYLDNDNRNYVAYFAEK